MRLRKEVGGLRVRRLREFNLALLGKRCWRQVTNREGLWFRLLAARYGLEGGRLQPGGREGSVWWREMVKIRDGFGSALGNWYVDNVRLKAGNRLNTLFWLDRWVGDVPLRVRYRRLFDLFDNKLVIVAQMFALGWDEGGGAWRWRRRLWAWEEELVKECRTLLLTVSLQVENDDVWTWIPDPLAGYTVRGAFRTLTNGAPLNHDVHLFYDDLLWRKDVPLKVLIFACRLFRNRLPTKVNLFRRGIIQYEDQMCVGGCGVQETNEHLFLNCGVFAQLWQLVRNWLHVYPHLYKHSLTGD